MKIQCDVCERATAAVLCCADEAALCWGCDEKVHAANKLAGTHQRVPLLLPASSSPSSSHIPSCDICQEKAGFFFCLEDRAVLCRQCDVTTHTASPYVSSHRRFLITGVRVGPQDKITSNSNNSSSCSNSSNSTLRSPVSNDSIADKMAVEEGVRSQWPWPELLDSLEFNQRYRLSNPVVDFVQKHLPVMALFVNNLDYFDITGGDQILEHLKCGLRNMKSTAFAELVGQPKKESFFCHNHSA